MTSLLSLPAFPRKLHRARHRFTGGLAPSVAHACRQWLRYGVRTGKVTPQEAIKALQDGDHQSGTLAACIARSCVRRPSASKLTLHSNHEYDHVSAVLKWLVSAGEIAPDEVPGLLREPHDAVARIERCFREAEDEARQHVISMYADDVPYERPIWELHLGLSSEVDSCSLRFALHLAEVPFASVCLRSPALPFLCELAHSYNDRSSFTHLSAPDSAGIEHIDWSLTEYVEDVLLRHKQGIPMRDAVDQVAEESGCDAVWLQDVVEEVDAVNNAANQNGPLTCPQAQIITAIEQMIAALPLAKTWKYASDDDESEVLHCVPGIIPGDALIDLAGEQLESDASNVGTYHGKLAFPSVSTFGSLRSLYLELHLHSAVLAHVRHIT